MEQSEVEGYPLVRADEVPEGGGKRVGVGGRQIALFKVAGRIYAVNARCPHAGAPLDMGWMKDHTVHCPMHGWDFDVRTGESQVVGARVACYDVEVRDGVVYLQNAACSEE